MEAFIVVVIVVVMVTAAFIAHIQRGSQRPAKIDEAPSRTLESLAIKFSIDDEPKQLAWKFRADGSGQSYFHVDLAEVTCTCDDFTSRRSRFARSDLRRFCGHIIRAYQKADSWPNPDGIMATLLASGPQNGGCWDYDDILRTKLDSGEYVYFGKKKNRTWIDVYAKARRKADMHGKYTGNYGRYGFDNAQKKWAYGTAPPGSREIKAILKAIQP